MPNANAPSVPAAAARGVVAGLAGVAVMTAFQRLVEMPLSGRGESDAPLRLVERLLPVRRVDGEQRRWRVYLVHVAIGGLWGAGHGLLSRATGARGQRAVALVFGIQYAGDIALSTAVGVYRPWDWSAQDWVIDAGNKLVLAEATAVAHDGLARAGG